MTTTTVLTITSDRTHADVCASLGTIVPGAVVERVEPALVRRLPQGALLVVSDSSHARLARATGFDGAIVIVGTPAGDEATSFLAQGASFVSPECSPAALTEALAQAFKSTADGMAASLRTAVARSRQLFAAGEIAFGLQHAFNNPLTALMAEIQLLQMDAPNDDIRAAADRMLELVRRLTGLSRQLDAVRDPINRR